MKTRIFGILFILIACHGFTLHGMKNLAERKHALCSDLLALPGEPQDIIYAILCSLPQQLENAVILPKGTEFLKTPDVFLALYIIAKEINLSAKKRHIDSLFGLPKLSPNSNFCSQIQTAAINKDFEQNLRNSAFILTQLKTFNQMLGINYRGILITPDSFNRSNRSYRSDTSDTDE